MENKRSVRDLPTRDARHDTVTFGGEMDWRLGILMIVFGLAGLGGVGCAPDGTAPRPRVPAAWTVPTVDKATVDACMVCHSTKEMQRGPVLDGLPAWYIEAQLKKFQTGQRGENPKNKAEQLMGAAMTKIKSDAELTALAVYFGKLKPKPSLRVIRGDTVTGQALYATRCATCHGNKGEGKRELNSPPVNVQEDWFLMDQLRKYASGQRGVHPGDAGGVLMKAAVANLSPTDLRNVVSYIAKNLTVTPPLQKVGPPKK